MSIALAVMPAITSAQRPAGESNPTVAASILESSVEAGEVTQYQITVTDGRADTPPPAPVVDGLSIVYAGQQSSQEINMTNGNFRSVNRLIYGYNVKANRPGRFTIPGQNVSVGGAILRTLPLTLNAVDPGSPSPGESITSELIIPKKNAYIGESVPVEVRTAFGGGLRFDASGYPTLGGEGYSTQKFTGSRPVDQIIEGVHQNVVIYRTALTGLKIGTLTVGPARTNPVVQYPRKQRRGARSRDPFDFSPFDAFGGLALLPPKQVEVATKAAEIEILPLPPGKPADFSGAIGQFKLEVEAEPRKVQAGDPVTIRLVLSGRGNFDRITAPVLSDERGLKTYPATSKLKADDDVNLSGVKTFEQVVLSDTARESLPPYCFSYLDPMTGKYVRLDTAPVAVKIEGGHPAPSSAVSTPAPSATGTATPTPTPAPPPRPAEDILYIRGDAGAAADRSVFQPLYRRRGFWLAQAIPCAGLLGAALWLMARARLRNETARLLSEAHRQRAELQRALRDERTGRRDFYVAAARLAELQTRRGGADAALSEPLREIFHRHDELAYSGGQVAREPVPADERRHVLAALETLGRSGK